MTPVASLRRVISGEVDDSTRRRAEYSSDASNYRVVPLAVAFPRTDDDLAAMVEWARQTGTALTMRGGGTSVAGNAVGPGVVVDTSRHLDRVVTLDPDRRIARVQPGVVLADLQAAAARFGLRVGPDPSTQGRATIGGMVGNNACGPRTVAYGRTADNVVSLDVVDGAGRALTVGDHGIEQVPEPPGACPSSARGHPDRARPVQPAGVGLLARAPAARPRRQRGPRARRLEGTLAVVTEVEARLVRASRRRRWPCSAIQRWRMPPIRRHRCSASDRSPSKASMLDSSTSSAGPEDQCRFPSSLGARAGSWSRPAGRLAPEAAARAPRSSPWRRPGCPGGSCRPGSPRALADP